MGAEIMLAANMGAHSIKMLNARIFYIFCSTSDNQEWISYFGEAKLSETVHTIDYCLQASDDDLGSIYLEPIVTKNVSIMKNIMERHYKAREKVTVLGVIKFCLYRRHIRSDINQRSLYRKFI